jgi:hypothetical protein
LSPRFGRPGLISDSSIIVIPPLAAMVFRAAGRNPVYRASGHFLWRRRADYYGMALSLSRELADFLNAAQVALGPLTRG